MARNHSEGEPDQLEGERLHLAQILQMEPQNHTQKALSPKLKDPTGGRKKQKGPKRSFTSAHACFGHKLDRISVNSMGC